MDAQEAKVRAWADLNGAEFVVVYRDAGLSGKRAENRPGLQDALKAVGRGDALVVYSLSRLARSTKDTIAIAEALDKRGADLVSLSEKIDTTTAAGKMVFRMLAVLSEFERDQVAERTRMALLHKRACGEKTGGDVPYGFRLESGLLVPDLGEKGHTMAETKGKAVGTLKQLNARLPLPLHRELKARCAMDGITIANVVERLVRLYLAGKVKLSEEAAGDR